MSAEPLNPTARDARTLQGRASHELLQYFHAVDHRKIEGELQIYSAKQPQRLDASASKPAMLAHLWLRGEQCKRFMCRYQKSMADFGLAIVA